MDRSITVDRGRMRTVAILGATGFLGSQLCAAFLRSGYRVIAVKRATSDLWRIAHLKGDMLRVDIDSPDLRSRFEREEIGAVINAVTHYGRHKDDPVESIASNVLAPVRVFVDGQRSGVSLFVNCDSFFAASNRLSGHLWQYSLAKSQLRDWLRRLSTKESKVANMQIHHVYGERDSPDKFVPWLIRRMIESKAPIELTDGTQERDFIYVDDVVSAIEQVVEFRANLPHFREYEVGSGSGVAVRSFSEKVAEIHQRESGRTASLEFGALGMKKGELKTAVADTNRLSAIGWVPRVSLDEGILRTYRWYAARPTKS